MNPISTTQVARKVGVSEPTLERWLVAGKIEAPKTLTVGQRSVRLWTEVDVKRIQKYKQENYWKGRGAKPKAKD